MRLLLPPITLAQATDDATEVERVIVTGSNIPTAEETGPNPVDTYRPGDIERLGPQRHGLPHQSAAGDGIDY